MKALVSDSGGEIGTDERNKERQTGDHVKKPFVLLQLLTHMRISGTLNVVRNIESLDTSDVVPDSSRRGDSLE